MENRFFITEVYVPSGCRTLEHNLAAYMRQYLDHVVSEGALNRLADELHAEQARLVEANRRLRPVEIFADLDGRYGFYSYHAGQVSLRLRLVKGEII